MFSVYSQVFMLGLIPYKRGRKLRVGDEVLMTDSDGETLRFHVRGVELYLPQAAPLQDISEIRGSLTQFNHLRWGLDSQPASNHSAVSCLYCLGIVFCPAGIGNC